jgi:hypothetical protein
MLKLRQGCGGDYLLRSRQTIHNTGLQHDHGGASTRKLDHEERAFHFLVHHKIVTNLNAIYVSDRTISPIPAAQVSPSMCRNYHHSQKSKIVKPSSPLNFPTFVQWEVPFSIRVRGAGSQRERLMHQTGYDLNQVRAWAIAGALEQLGSRNLNFVTTGCGERAIH